MFETELKRLLSTHARNLIEAALLETDNAKRTVFHLAVLHQMPTDVVHKLLDYMRNDFYKQDAANRSAIDYLVSNSIVYN